MSVDRTDENAKILLSLGKAEVDAMFQRQTDFAVDVSEFLALVEVVLNAFETVGNPEVVEQVWECAFDRHSLERVEQSHPVPPEAIIEPHSAVELAANSLLHQKPCGSSAVDAGGWGRAMLAFTLGRNRVTNQSAGMGRGPVMEVSPTEPSAPVSQHPVD